MERNLFQSPNREGDFSALVHAIENLQTSNEVSHKNGHKHLFFNDIDSPATTSATTYKVQMKTSNAAATAILAESGSAFIAVVEYEP